MTAPCATLDTPLSGTWKAKIVATNRHGNSVSGLSAAFTVAVTDKPIITNDAQVGWH